MTTCPYCGESLIEGALFCMNCGMSLQPPAKEENAAGDAQKPPVCVNCGAALAPGAGFCMECGNKVTMRDTAPTDAGSAQPEAQPQTVQPQIAETQVAQQPAQQTVQQQQPTLQQPQMAQPYAQAQPIEQAQQPYAQAQVQAQPFAQAQAQQQPPGAYTQQPVPPPPGAYTQQPVPPPVAFAQPATLAAPDTPQADAAAKKPFYKKPVIIAAAAALIVLIAAVGFIAGTSGFGFGAPGLKETEFSVSGDYLAYIKDGEMKVAGVKSLESAEVTSDLLSGAPAKNIAGGGFLNGEGLIQMTANGQRLFYPDRFIADGSYNLFTRTVSGGGKTVGESARLDTDIRGIYRVNENGNAIFYIKGEARTLYSHNMKDRTKIASGVDEFVINRTGTRVYYTDADSGLYFKNRNAAAEKVDSESALIGASPDLSSVYYIKDSTLYRKKINENKERISAGITRFICLYDSGEMYYTKEADSGGKSAETLHYYSGSAETKLSAGLQFNGVLDLNASAPVLVYTVYESADKNSIYRIAIKGFDMEITVSKTFRDPTISRDGTKLYYVDDFNEVRQTGDLWRADISADGMKQAVQIHDDVFDFLVTSKGGVAYYSEISKNGSSAELLFNGKMLDTDVLIYSARENADSGNVLYFTDFNASKGRGALKIGINGKPAAIADDVARFAPFGGKTAVYLVIEGSASTGDLYRYDGSANKKLFDTDVALMLPVYLTGSGCRSIRGNYFIYDR